MKDDAEDTANRLYVLAGMIMEDCLDTALGQETGSLEDRGATLISAGDDIATLARAALLVAKRYSNCS